MKIHAMLLAAFIASPTIALAAETDTPAPAAQSGGHKRWAACADDLNKFCADIEKGKGKKRACLDAHAAELSDTCKQSMAEHASSKGGTPN